MSENELHREAPPPEAYSRVTNPERFLPLHNVALALLDRLRADYDVAQTDKFELLPGMQSFEQARAPVTLTPLAPEAAPVAIAFTPFPSLVVRYGWWLAEPFPSCACDACAETAAREGERLEATLAAVVAGHFREELTIPLIGRASLRWALGAVPENAGRMGGEFLSRDRARTLQGSGPRRIQWRPWPMRARGAHVRAHAVER